MRRTLEPSDVTVICDRKEQKPWNLSPLRMIDGTLQTGDYTLFGLESHIAIERKSLDDFVQCIGRDRDRFDREMDRIRAYPVRAVVVEASWSDLEAGAWRSQVKPNAAIGSALGWIAAGVPIIMAGSREAAERFAARMMFIVARRRWAELLSFGNAVLDARANPLTGDRGA